VDDLGYPWRGIHKDELVLVVQKELSVDHRDKTEHVEDHVEASESSPHKDLVYHLLLAQGCPPAVKEHLGLKCERKDEIPEGW